VAGKGVTTSATVTELATKEAQIYGKPKPGFPATQRITAGERAVPRGTATIVQAGTEAAPKDMLAEDVAAKVEEKLEADRDIYVADEKGRAIPVSGIGRKLRAAQKVRIGKEAAHGKAVEGAWKGLGLGLRIGVPIAVGGIVAALSISVIWGSLKSVSVDFAAMPEEQQYVIIAIIGICIFAVVAYLTWQYMGEH
jgi:hypothetical protein